MSRRSNIDPLLTEVHDLLYRLGVKATIQGFFETSCAVFLVMRREDRSWFSIMDLYAEIANLYHMDQKTIDPHIRHVIRKVWKSNPERLNRIAGEELETMPSPREFINILCRHLTSRGL